MWPGLWDLSAGGAALAGENSRQAAERETWEELGYALDLRGVRPALTVNFSRGFDDLYALVRDVELSRLRMQPSEVEALAWLERDQVQQKIDRGEFVPYRRALIDLLFDMRGAWATSLPDRTNALPPQRESVFWRLRRAAGRVRALACVAARGASAPCQCGGSRAISRRAPAWPGAFTP